MTASSPTPDTPEQRASRNPIRRLFDWVLSWADTPYGLLAMALVSFADSSFFPVPPDPLNRRS